MTCWKILLSLSLCWLAGAGALRGQPLLYVGLQGGTAAPALRPAAADPGLSPAAGSGRSLGLFLRYGRRSYCQLGMNWMRGRGSWSAASGGAALMEETPVRQTGIGARFGYQLWRTPRLQWRADTGPHLGNTTAAAAQAFGGQSLSARHWSWQLATGIDFLHFNLDLIYQHGLGRLRSAAAAPGAPGDWKLHVLMLQGGIHL